MGFSTPGFESKIAERVILKNYKYLNLFYCSLINQNKEIIKY